jgi:ribosomal protein L37AE/L43A
MSSALARFEEARAQMKIDPSGKVRIAFEMDVTGTAIEAVFECLSCNEFMVWRREKTWWFCPACGYELTIPEAGNVVQFAQAKLTDLSEAISGRKPEKRIERGTRWALVEWLRKLMRRREV